MNLQGRFTRAALSTISRARKQSPVSYSLAIGCAVWLGLNGFGLPGVAQNLFVSNLGTGSVWEFGPSGNLITSTFASGLETPQGIAFDRSGNLYVVHGGNNTRVAKYGPNGNLLNGSFISGLPVCSGLAIDSGGNFYVGNFGYGRIAKWKSHQFSLCLRRVRGGIHRLLARGARAVRLRPPAPGRLHLVCVSAPQTLVSRAAPARAPKV